MIHPPKCSTEWTIEERCALASWIAGLALDRISRDNAKMPVLAKAPVTELFRTIHLVLNMGPGFLEANREALEKPYDSNADYNSRLVTGDLSILPKTL